MKASQGKANPAMVNELLKKNDNSTLGEAIDMLKRVPESKHYDLLTRLDAMTKIMAL